MTASAPAERSWFGHPPGLTVLFLTQTWEQFSFYGMRTLLVYYMTKQLLFAQGQASMVYGLYTAFVYFTPIIGGIVTDRWLTRRHAVIAGGLIMAVGHFAMASESLFYVALGLIAVGNGLFLPSLPSQIKGLYDAADPRRGTAFNFYYLGINVGAFMAPLVCGTVGELYGWHWGFSIAGAGMVLGLILYIAGGRYLPAEEPKSAPPRVQLTAPGLNRRTAMVLVAVALVVVVFRGAYEQMGNTIAIWIDASVDRTVSSGLVIPATWFQSVNPMLVFLLTPLLVTYWTRRARAGADTAPLIQMSQGAAGVAVAFAILAIVAGISAHSGVPASWGWLAFFLFLFTLSELFILPIGLGLFARLAPSRHAATTIAAWFFAAFAGNLLAGALAGVFWSRLGAGGFFGLMAAVAGVAALLLFSLGRSNRGLERAEEAAVPDTSRS